MKLDIYYDSTTDTLSLWNGRPASEGADVAENLIVDFGRDGEVVGFTLDHAAELLGMILSTPSKQTSRETADSGRRLNFWESVYKLRANRQIPFVWTRADLKQHLSGKFASGSISTIPSNASMTRDGKEKGDYVRRGQRPKAWRVGRGKFQLINDPYDD